MYTHQNILLMAVELGLQGGKPINNGHGLVFVWALVFVRSFILFQQEE
jgi:hypothetical protein